MNGRKAKMLRAEARSLSVGEPNVRYFVKNPSKPVRGYLPGVPAEQYPVVTPPGTLALRPECTRAVYQRLKT